MLQSISNRDVMGQILVVIWYQDIIRVTGHSYKYSQPVILNAAIFYECGLIK